MRSVLIHYHIFKNAGTSVDTLLKESFAEKWHSFEADRPGGVLSPAEVSDYVEQHPSLVALSSHTAFPPVPQDTYYPIVLLRHPIIRIRSMQRFLSRDTTQHQHNVAKNGFPEYVKWLLESDAEGRSVGRDFQVHFLSDATYRYPRGPLTAEDLQKAKLRLSKFPAFGLVNQFSSSMKLFSKRYKSIFPDLSLYERRDNSSTPTKATEEEELNSIETELGSDLLRQLVDVNQLDMELFRFAQQYFSELLERHKISAD